MILKVYNCHLYSVAWFFIMICLIFRELLPCSLYHGRHIGSNFSNSRGVLRDSTDGDILRDLNVESSSLTSLLLLLLLLLLLMLFEGNTNFWIWVACVLILLTGNDVNCGDCSLCWTVNPPFSDVTRLTGRLTVFCVEFMNVVLGTTDVTTLWDEVVHPEYAIGTVCWAWITLLGELLIWMAPWGCKTGMT